STARKVRGMVQPSELREEARPVFGLSYETADLWYHGRCFVVVSVITTMLSPQRAAVRPRVLSEDSGALPLEDEIQELVTAGHSGVVYLLGSPGSGKTSALQHLAAVMPADAAIILLDETDRHDAREDAFD